MVKDHTDSESGNPLPPHGLLFPINSKGSFIWTIHRQDSTYHGLCYTSRGALAGTINTSMGPPHEGFFYMHHPTDRITHTTAFVTPVVEHWLEREVKAFSDYFVLT